MNYFHFLYTHFVYIHHFYILGLLDKLLLYLIFLLLLPVLLLPVLLPMLVKMFFALFFLMKKNPKVDLMEEILMVCLVTFVLDFPMEELVVILVLMLSMICLEDSYTELIPFP